MIFLTEQEKETFHEILLPYENDEIVLKMKNYCQHGNVSTYEHVMNVALTCFYINRKKNFGCNEIDLVTAAFLHDFYLYDWHKKDNNTHRLHGFFHPMVAAINATKYFHVNKSVRNIILCHMWPLTFFHFPKSKEALLVSLVDKYCCIREVFYSLRKKNALKRKKALAFYN